MLLSVSICFFLMTMGSADIVHRTVFIEPLIPGAIVTVEGTVKANPNTFALNLVKDNDNFPLHFNPRFKGKAFSVCNAMVKGGWQKEERQNEHFPFVPGKKFKVDFECHHDSFKVFVNGKLYMKCVNQLKSLKDIKSLVAIGDVVISRVDAGPLGQ